MFNDVTKKSNESIKLLNKTGNFASHAVHVAKLSHILALLVRAPIFYARDGRFEFAGSYLYLVVGPAPLNIEALLKLL